MAKFFLASILSASFLIVATTGVVQAEEVFQFAVQAEQVARKDSPIWVDLPKALQNVEGDLVLRQAAGGGQVVSQKSEDGKRLVFIPKEEIPATQGRLYQIQVVPKSDSTPADSTFAVRCIKDDKTVSLALGDQKILTYNTAVLEPPAGTSELYRRSGFIHPFVTPQGKVVTDGFPSDHLHQHGIFAAWTKTFFEGEGVNFWDQLGGTGTVGHREILETTSGDVFASFKVRLAHVLTKGEPRDVLDEVWTVRLYNLPKMHQFDIESVQTCVAKTPLTIAEYHYGGFAYRGSAEWIKNDQHHIITNETDDREVGNHTKPNWVGVYGPVQGDLCGAAMFSHPTNFRSPQPVRLHPSMPYFVYSPAVLGEFELAPGKPFAAKYRYLSYDGKPDAKRLDSAWKNYSSAPKIQWVTATAP
ncbi:DUF6807 domain-containing protein [Thalassoglobus polymorphus]|uniref:Methane oxygenase PmoA n=1 Tax=Thalassoglobus polymorphus TaxID=2527994 RepID=A0A517QUT2_9PLAN|nr:PmoA family protein [Thalassoglobus polymorphus]QDT35347.1 hypothetical protein Mal48_46230 [Thalassoglobus polymorphus]